MHVDAEGGSVLAVAIDLNGVVWGEDAGIPEDVTNSLVGLSRTKVAPELITAVSATDGGGEEGSRESNALEGGGVGDEHDDYLLQFEVKLCCDLLSMDGWSFAGMKSFAAQRVGLLIGGGVVGPETAPS